MAYEKVTGPLDSRFRMDIAAGIVAATVHNSQGGKRKAKASDFIPTWFKRRKSPKELWQEVMKANSALGGSIASRNE